MTDDPTPKAVAALIQRLRGFLLSPNKAGREEHIIVFQSRHVGALVAVADFLTAGGEKDLSLKIMVLADAIEQLANGRIEDVLRKAPGRGRGPDGRVLWSLREEVDIGLECILRSRKFETQKKAATYIAGRYPVFNQLKRDTRNSLASSISSWRRRINDGDVPEAEAVRDHRHRFFEQYGGDNRSSAEMFALGEQLLAQAAEKTTNAYPILRMHAAF